MSSHKKRKYESCTLCKTQLIYPQKANTANKLEDSEVLERIKQFHRDNINETKMSTFIMCETCRSEVDAAYKCVVKCQELITDQPSISPKQLEDAITQTESFQQTIIIINGLPKTTKPKEMEDQFSEYGKIVNYYLKTDPIGGIDNFAWINFSKEDEALKVMNAARNKNLWYQQKCLTVVTQVSEDSSPIDMLPDVCLSEIFLRIDEVEEKVDIGKVCKRWKKVLAKSWSNITRFSNISEMDEITTYGGSRSVLKGCGRFLESLRLNITDTPIPFIRLIHKYCGNIENLQLDLSCIARTGEFQHEILSVFQKCTKLKRLCIQELDLQFNYTYLEHLPEEMLELHLYCDNIDVRPLIDLRKFQNLEALALYNFSIQADSLHGLDTLINMKHLSFEGSNVNSNNIRQILNFNKLKYLVIPDCGLDDEMLSQIVRNNPDLECLDISDNPDITDQSFQYVTHLPKLETLYMKNLREVTGSNWTGMHALERLDVEGCASLSDWTLSLLIDKSLKLHTMHAAGASTWRLLMNVHESIELRDGTNVHFWLFTDDHLVERWNTSGIQTKLFVICRSRSTEVEPFSWVGWCGDVEQLI